MRPAGASAAWHRPIRLTAAAVLVFMSAFSLGCLLREVGWQPSGPALAGAVIFMLGFVLGCVSGFMLGRTPGGASKTTHAGEPDLAVVRRRPRGSMNARTASARSGTTAFTVRMQGA